MKTYALPFIVLVIVTLFILVKRNIVHDNDFEPNQIRQTPDNTAFEPNVNVTEAFKIVPRYAEQFEAARSNAWLARQLSSSWEEDPKAQEALKQQRVDRDWNWKRNIDFWGIVMDEASNNVPGAKVVFSWTDLSSKGNSTETAISDESGLVSLIGKRGYILVIQASKDGYYPTKGSNMSLNFAEPWDITYHVPNMNQPVILKLHRESAREPLVSRMNLRYRLSDESKDISIDLLGQIESRDNIDLRFTLSHGPENYLDGKRRFDWSVQVAAADGGLVEYDEEFPFLAPENSYEPVLKFSMKADDPNWTGGVSRKCYFRSRGGQHFGRVEFQVSPFPKGSPPSVTLVEYYLNPAGSRNLEYARELDVSEKYYIPR